MVGAALASNQKLYMVPQRACVGGGVVAGGAAQTPGPVLVQNEPVGGAGPGHVVGTDRERPGALL